MLPLFFAVYTAIDDVQTCLPLAGGDVLAGTQGGLVRVAPDGAVRAVWTALDGLPGTRVGALADAGGGEVWVGGELGVARVRPGEKVAATWPSKPVRAFLLRDGVLLAATWGDGVVSIGEGGVKPVAAAGAQATSLALVDGTLWIGTTAGLVRASDGRTAGGLPSPMVWSLAVVDHRLHAGTLGGVATVDTTTALARRDGESRADTRALLVDGAGLLAGTYGAGLAGVPELAAVHVNGLAQAHGVTCVAAREGLWTRAAAGAWTKARLAGPPSNDVAALAVDGDAVWLGTFDRGLALRKGDSGWTTVDGVDARVNALSVGGGGVWVATARGLFHVGGDGKLRARWGTREGLPSAEVHTVVALPDGALVGTTRGLAILRGNAPPVVIGERQGLPSAGVWAVAQEAPEVYWIATGRGVVRWDHGRKRRYSMASGDLDEDWVTAVLLDGDDVWIGTYGKGVTRLHRSGKGFVATHLGGGPINVGGLARDGDWLYAATMAGLKRRPVAGDGAWETVGGTPGTDVTAVIPTPDALWIATRRGVVATPR